MADLLRKPFGTRGKVHQITPESAGWRYVGFSLYRMHAGDTAGEATGEYDGLYHALLGHLSPLHGVGPDDLTIDRLEARCGSGEIQEVILATDPTVEGETTALYISRRLLPLGIAVSRPASGIPVGGEVAAVDRVTLAQALQRRRVV